MGNPLILLPPGVPAQTDYVPYISNPGGSWSAKRALVSDLVPSSSIYFAKNNSAYQLTQGMAVVMDATADIAVTTTTKSGDASVCGVVLAQTIPIGSSGAIITQGLQTVKVSGNVIRGHWLRCSATPGYAEDAGTVQRPLVGAIGIAMTAFTGATGTVSALLSINPYASTSTLQQLPTVTTNSGTGTSLATGHTIDSGTDLTIVRISNTGGVAINSVTLGATTITIKNQISSSTNTHVALAFIQNPTPGANTITVTPASSCTMQVEITNYQGSQPVPFRDSQTAGVGTGSGTSASLSLTSLVGDLGLDVINVGVSGWAVNAGQTRDMGSGGTFGGSNKPGAAGSTSMGWSGGSGSYAYMAVMIAGS